MQLDERGQLRSLSAESLEGSDKVVVRSRKEIHTGNGHAAEGTSEATGPSMAKPHLRVKRAGVHDPESTVGSLWNTSAEVIFVVSVRNRGHEPVELGELGDDASCSLRRVHDHAVSGSQSVAHPTSVETSMDHGRVEPHLVE